MEIKNHLTDLIEPETLRKIESSLSAMFGMAAWISDENGVGDDSGTGFPRYADLCMRSPAGRKDCERCIREGAERSDDSKKPGRSECLGGLTVFSAPIKAADKTVGILSGGWVLMEDPDFDKICQTAKAVGAKITDVSGRPSACGSSGYLIVSRDRFGEDAKSLLSSNSELRGIILERYDSVEQFNIPNVEVVNKPAYSMNLYAAMGLCKGFERDSSGEDAELSFTAPDAHILIVDDNAINLSVAKGVIEPLGMHVDTATSAAECIEKVRSCRYDIVFMDHMMPEVDGIEAAHMIREKFPAYADVPIIALTANVSGGAREMFLKEGMNDFIAKPIELRDMVNKIRRWLSEEKIVPVSAARNQKQQPAAIQAESACTFPRIRGIDTESAMALLKNEALLKSVMEQFYRSIDRNESRIRTLWKNNDIKNFTIEVHALKSTAKQIGANHLSSVCALLEQAGNKHDMDFISRHTNAMLIEYLRLKQEMGKYFTEANKPVFLSGHGTNGGSANSPAPAAMAPATQEERDLFNEMQNALEEMDTIQIDDVMEKLSAGQYDPREMEYFERLKNAVDEYYLDAAQEVLTQWRKNKGAM